MTQIKTTNRSGFTLLEIIIVIIIVGVLAGIALPRMSKLIQYSYSTEAIETLGAIRKAMFRCSAFTQGCFTGCQLNVPAGTSSIDLEDPALAPNAHFSYTARAVGSCSTFSGYRIIATRNTRDGGDNASSITMELSNITQNFDLYGDGIFIGI